MFDDEKFELDDIDDISDEDFDEDLDGVFEDDFDGDIDDLGEIDLSGDDDFDNDFGEGGLFGDDSEFEASTPKVNDSFKVASGEFKKYDTRPVCAMRLFSAPSFKKR